MTAVEPQYHPTSNDVIILAGGLGRRLRKSLGGLPKPMISILGRPFLEWMLLHLRSLGFRSFVVSVGYRSDSIQEHFGSGDRWGVKVRYAEERVPLGTGGAVKKAAAAVQSADVLVMNGDSLCVCDMKDFYRFHRESGGQATLCCARVKDTSRYGAVTTGPGHRIARFSEKGESRGAGLINAGMYWMQRSFMEDIEDRAPLSLENDVFPGRVNKGLYAYCSGGAFLDIGTPDSLGSAPAFLASNGLLELAQSTGETQ